MNKRPNKPRTQYSPSNPVPTNTCHLVTCSDTGNLIIVGNSSVKRIDVDGVLSINDGRTGTLVMSGTKEKCIERWNDIIRQNIDADIDEAEEDEDSSIMMKQTLQAPPNTFMTPAPYRRKHSSVTRSKSPDSMTLNSSGKRFAGMNDATHSSQRPTSSRLVNRTLLDDNNTSSSSSEEETTDRNGDEMSLDRIFLELKNTQSNIKDARSENQDMHQKIKKLTQKIHQFKTLVFSKTDEDLDRYRDHDQKEKYPESVIFEGRDLLDERARNPGQYARNLLRVLFTPEELQSSLLPSSQSKRYVKPELDSKRMDLLHDAIRTRYRIGKHYYESFYTERIQATLAACLYNEGRRKLKHQLSRDNDNGHHSQATTTASASTVQAEQNE